MAPTLSPRQVIVTDTSGSGSGSGGSNGLDTGAIVGIVIGSIAGILLLWWIIKSCTKPRVRSGDRQGWYDDSRPRPRSRSRSRSAHRHHHHHHHSRRRSSGSRVRPVVYQEKVAGYAVPAQPAQAYVYPSRSRSRSQGRARGYYTTTTGGN
ncbi:hypothetical protein QBC35DRAFT_60770 [Podospora australis]|uniref:Uncharacterized protein n=1 Tax=Podospora australis TaxID=1536484 RepID=A0AAN6WLK5_9PEZI|nr:hypothetical protein QBC35DRAFT_60770 [Podospora australis]